MSGPRWYRVTVMWAQEVVVEVNDDPAGLWPEIEIERAAVRHASSIEAGRCHEFTELLSRRPEQVDLWALPDGEIYDRPPLVTPPPEVLFELDGHLWCSNGDGLWRNDVAPTARGWRDDVAVQAAAVLALPRGADPILEEKRRPVDGLTEIVFRGEERHYLVDAALMPTAFDCLAGGLMGDEESPCVWALLEGQVVAMVMTRRRGEP